MLPRNHIAEILATAERPAVFVSFGKDSLLILTLAREINPNIPVYYFGDELSAFAQEYIINNDLTVFSYAPADRYLVGTNEGLALVDEYAINDTRIPVVTDISVGDNCKHGVSTQRTASMKFPHDVVLWGYKRSDEVDTIGCVLDKEILVGSTKFIAPLYELADTQVYEALDELQVPYDDSQNTLEFCDNCMNEIVQSGWDAQAALSNFRTRFSFNH